MTTVRVQVNDDKKLKALIAFLKTVDMPCEIEKAEYVPNEETIEAMKDARSGKGTKFKNSAELFSKYK